MICSTRELNRTSIFQVVKSSTILHQLTTLAPKNLVKGLFDKTRGYGLLRTIASKALFPMLQWYWIPLPTTTQSWHVTINFPIRCSKLPNDHELVRIHHLLCEVYAILAWTTIVRYPQVNARSVTSRITTLITASNLAWHVTTNLPIRRKRIDKVFVYILLIIFYLFVNFLLVGVNEILVKVWGKRAPGFLKMIHLAFAVGAVLVVLLLIPFKMPTATGNCSIMLKDKILPFYHYENYDFPLLLRFRKFELI